MRKSNGTVLLLFAAATAVAQIVSPMSLSQTGTQRVQQLYLADLKQVAEAARGISFPFPFYFSRQLDIDEAQQRRMSQASIQFERYNGQVVLSITGNYYASYAGEQMDQQQRVRQTFTDVLLPLLRAAVPPMRQREFVSGFAIEVAHHVRKKMLGVDAEGPENVALVLPRAAAEKLLSATTDEARQAALLEGEMVVNGEPFALWLSGDVAPEVRERAPVRRARKLVRRGDADDEDWDAIQPAPPAVAAPAPTVSAKLLALPQAPLHFITDRELKILESAQAPALARLQHDLAPQMHFVAYAPPSFISFHDSAYLQLSFETLVGPAPASSRYRLAALAFDDHIIHLVRPVLQYFSAEPGFDGVDFSTTIRSGDGSAPLSVEFLVPLNAMRCFADYSCTGQQLLNAGFVLINGERAGLQLEEAERR